MGWVWDLRQAWKDSTALCKILNSEIIRDPNRISQDPGQNPVQSLWDLGQAWKHSTALCKIVNSLKVESYLIYFVFFCFNVIEFNVIFLKLFFH